MRPQDDRDPALTAALRALARHDTDAAASPHVEARLLDEVRSLGRARRLRAFWTVGAVAAALLVIGVSLPLWRSRVPETAPKTELKTEVFTEFFPLAYSRLPISGGHLIRLEVPELSLASFGLAAPDALDASRTVLADVLVGDDGLARAVRFVRAVAHKEK